MQTQKKRNTTLLCDVVHDLRQPLGIIEISAYLLKKALADATPEVRAHLDAIERQIDVAVRVLADAASEWQCARDQTAETGNLDLTKAETAAVT
jgi:signal transduction histidine kinase